LMLQAWTPTELGRRLRGALEGRERLLRKVRRRGRWQARRFALTLRSHERRAALRRPAAREPQRSHRRDRQDDSDGSQPGRAGHRALSLPGRPGLGSGVPRAAPRRYARRTEGGPMKLYIGNKNYSNWSLRPWLLLRHAGIPFEEEKISFNAPDFKERVRRVSPAG